MKIDILYQLAIQLDKEYISASNHLSNDAMDMTEVLFMSFYPDLILI